VEIGNTAIDFYRERLLSGNQLKVFTGGSWPFRDAMRPGGQSDAASRDRRLQLTRQGDSRLSAIVAPTVTQRRQKVALSRRHLPAHGSARHRCIRGSGATTS
jgi:hypothetical protein